MRRMIRNTSFNSKFLIRRTWDFCLNNIWLVFLIWSLWLSLEYFALGPFSYITINDQGDSIYPEQIAFIQGFFKNGLTQWFPYGIGGFPNLSQEWLSIARIDSLFFSIFPDWLPNGLVEFLQRFLAGFFTYRLCKDYLKIDKLLSFVAGLIYSTTTFFYISQLFTVAGFPFILWSLEYVSEKRNVTKYVLAFLLGILTTLSITVAWSMPFILIMILAWFVLVRRKYSLQFFGLFAIFSMTLLAGKANNIISLLLNGPSSHRAFWTYPNPLLPDPLWHIFKLIGRFFISNIIYLILGILGLYWYRFKERSLLMIMILLIICGIAGYLLHTINIYFGPYIGFFRGFNFTLFVNWTPFFAVITGAYSLHLLRNVWSLSEDNSKNKMKYQLNAILCVIGIFLVFFSSFTTKYNHAREWLIGSSYSINYKNYDLQNLAKEMKSEPFRIATIAASADSLFHPGFLNAYSMETIDGANGLYPKRYHDFWGKVIEPVALKDENVYNQFRYWGSWVYLFSPSFNKSTEKIKDLPVSEYYNLNLLSLANTKYLISRMPVSNENLKLLPSQIPDIKITPQAPRTDKVHQYIKLNFTGRRMYIYKNENYFPRFFLSGKATLFKDSNQLLDNMAKADIATLRSNVFIEEKFVSKIDVENLGFTQGEVEIKQYSPDKIILVVKMNKPGIIVIQNSYNQYWKGKVNGIMKDIFPAYYVFMGIFLEEGENKVELKYSPPYWPF